MPVQSPSNQSQSYVRPSYIERTFPRLTSKVMQAKLNLLGERPEAARSYPSALSFRTNDRIRPVVRPINTRVAEQFVLTQPDTRHMTAAPGALVKRACDEYRTIALLNRSSVELDAAAAKLSVQLGHRKMSDESAAWALRSAASPADMKVEPGTLLPMTSNALSVELLVRRFAIDKGGNQITLKDLAGLRLAIDQGVKDPDVHRRCIEALAWETNTPVIDTGEAIKKVDPEQQRKNRLDSAVDGFVDKSRTLPLSTKEAFRHFIAVKVGRPSGKDFQQMIHRLNDHHQSARSNSQERERITGLMRFATDVMVTAWTRGENGPATAPMPDFKAIVDDTVDQAHTRKVCMGAVEAALDEHLTPTPPDGLEYPLSPSPADAGISQHLAPDRLPLTPAQNSTDAPFASDEVQMPVSHKPS